MFPKRVKWCIKMKKLLVLGGLSLSLFISSGVPATGISETKVALYALDGRVEYFDVSQVSEQLSVGWYEEPMQYLYALDGRCVLFKQSEVEEQLTVGWYVAPVQLLYAADGRTEVFYKTDVPAQLTVGWYENKIDANKANIRSKITQSDIADLANVMHSEANGLSTREVAMVAWCVLNRVDVGQGTIHSICNSNQFTRKGNKTQYAWLAEDVLERYYLEKTGVQDVGRVLPNNYLYFTGDGKHNYFRSSFKGARVLYFPELTNPYE
jgi:hypothetical protein